MAKRLGDEVVAKASQEGKDLDPLTAPIPPFELAEVAAYVERVYGLLGTLTPLSGERDLNVRLIASEGDFAIKIANAGEPAAALDLQLALLEHLAASDPTLPVARVRRSLAGRRVESIERGGQVFAVRCVTFLPGITISDAAVSLDGARLRRETGALLARFQRAAHGFFHPAADRNILWDLRRLGELRPLLSEIGSFDELKTVERILDRFERVVRPVVPRLRAQVIHNDFNPDNLVVDDRGALAGILDFGDVLHGPRVMDLAVAAAYQVLGLPSGEAAIAALSEFVAGYDRELGPENRLGDDELSVLLDLVLARLAQSRVVGLWRAESHPENRDYILHHAAPVAAALHGAGSFGEIALRDLAQVEGWLRDACGRADLVAPAATADLAARRRQVLAPGLRISYREPLHPVRGEGIWLIDSNGRRLLDAYNNVAQLGHSHPQVVDALARQARALNTNTRYLTDAVVAYAEELGSLLPGDLSVCYFVCSGSEANDLAWRIAKTVTGNAGAIVTEHAYHGATDAVMAMSPEEHRRAPLADWVATIAPPRPGVDGGEEVERAITTLGRAGHRPAALLLDSIFSSDGIWDAPASYFESSAAAVRSAGGLWIADEVQAGLGRVGKRFWGFAAGSAIPDLVTLGKPLGNGHPIGAVVTTPAIAEAFARGGYYFSTFGGNPVSAEVGRAVLAVTLKERLAERADSVGDALRQAIRNLGHPAIREVRGVGQFTGVELKDGDLAREVVEGLRNRGVLVGRTGPRSDVLKLRPPLVFGREHAERLVVAVSEVLTFC